MRTMLTTLITSAALLLATTAYAAPKIGNPAPDFTANGIAGEVVSPSAYKGKIIVLEWTNPDCPFVHKHYDSNNMQELQTYAQTKDVVWISINSSAEGKEGHLTEKQARDYLNSNKIHNTHYVLDAEGTIGTLYGAKTTPHMFVIDAKGNLAYMGAIDNKPDAEVASVKTANNYVRDAIDSLIAGTPVKVATTQSYGCYVKYGN